MNPTTYVASLVFPLGGSVGDKREIAVSSSYQAPPHCGRTSASQAHMLRVCSGKESLGRGVGPQRGRAQLWSCGADMSEHVLREASCW